jgi:hypothetical protein
VNDEDRWKLERAARIARMASIRMAVADGDMSRLRRPAAPDDPPPGMEFDPETVARVKRAGSHYDRHHASRKR